MSVRADECFKEIDPEDGCYRTVADDKNRTIVCSSWKGAEIMITHSDLFYKSPDSAVWESIVDVFFSRQAERDEDGNI